MSPSFLQGVSKPRDDWFVKVEKVPDELQRVGNEVPKRIGAPGLIMYLDPLVPAHMLSLAGPFACVNKLFEAVSHVCRSSAGPKQTQRAPYFLSQSIEEAGQTAFNVVWRLNNNSQVAKPPLVQTANMVEIHYVLEDESAARPHFVPKN